MKILIGLPTNRGDVSGELAAWLCNDVKGHATCVPVSNFLTDVARNALVAEARRRRCSVLMMIDADCVPPRRSFHQLVLKAHQVQGVAGCPMTTAGGSVAVQDRDGRYVTPAQAASLSGWARCSNLSTHLIAYSVPCFDRVSRTPLFEYRYTEAHDGIEDTEDFVANRKLADAGVELWVNWSIWPGHKKVRVMGRPEPARPEVLAALERLCPLER